MQQYEGVLRQLTLNIQQLNDSVASSEKRFRSLERMYRWGGLVLLSAIALIFYIGLNVADEAKAQQSIVKGIDQDAKKVTQDALRISTAERLQLAKTVEHLREDLRKGKASPETIIAIVLHDMKVALESMPDMAEDMDSMSKDMAQMNGKMTAVPVMAAEMQKMNATMAVMGAGVDSTMGRMGRIIPWSPW